MGHRIRILMIIPAIILGCLSSWGQNISLYSLTTNDGLSHIKVNDVYTDEHGMIWAGTDYGLNRYDGHSVEVFLNNKEDQYLKQGTQQRRGYARPAFQVLQAKRSCHCSE